MIMESPHNSIRRKLRGGEADIVARGLGGGLAGPKHSDLADVGVAPILMVGDDRQLQQPRLQVVQSPAIPRTSRLGFWILGYTG